MKRTCFFLLLCGLTLIRQTTARAQQPDPLNELMFTPKIIAQHADELGLEVGQKEFVQSQLRQMQEKHAELQQNLQREVAALGEILHQESPDEAKAIAQLDKVLESEREIKRGQISLALSIRARLTAEQKKRIGEIQAKMVTERSGPAGQFPASLKAKMQETEALARKAQQNGQDLSAVKPMMEEVHKLMQNSKFKEAEEGLDRIQRAIADAAKK